MAYKLLALDLDGTLLNENQAISSETKNTIKKIKKRYTKILIATGRMFISAVPFIKKLNLSGSMITYNGAYVKKYETDELIYHKPIERDIAQMLIKEAQDHNLHIQVYHGDKLYIKERNEIIDRYEKTAGVSAICLNQLSDIDGNPTKLLIIENNREKFEYYYKHFADKFGHKVEVAESIRNYLELGAKGVNKALALKFIAKRHNIKRSEVVCAGDSWNDSEMIKWAGTGIAMYSSPQELKEKADIIAPPESKGGLNSVLRDLFNI